MEGLMEGEEISYMLRGKISGICENNTMLECFNKNTIKVNKKGYIIAFFNDRNVGKFWSLLGGNAYELGDPFYVGDNSFEYAASDYYKRLESAHFQPVYLADYAASSNGNQIFPYQDSNPYKTYRNYSATVRRRIKLWRQFSFTCSFVKWIREDIYNPYNYEFLRTFNYPSFRNNYPVGFERGSLIDDASLDRSLGSSLINLALLNSLLLKFTGHTDCVVIIQRTPSSIPAFGFRNNLTVENRNIRNWNNEIGDIFPFSPQHEIIRTIYGSRVYPNALLGLIKVYTQNIWELEGEGDKEYDSILENIRQNMFQKAKESDLNLEGEYSEQDSEEEEEYSEKCYHRLYD